MDLLANPFNVLEATPRDNRSKIMELADDRSLIQDSDGCMQARSDLINPRKRLSAEVAWLPGTSPKRRDDVLNILESSTTDLISIDNVTPIARGNLLSAGLKRLATFSSDSVTEWIIEIAWTFEEIDVEEVAKIINQERIVSSFPEVTDLSAVEEEIQERRLYYKQVIKSALNGLSSIDLIKVITEAVESTTYDGEDQAPIIIDDLVDSYELEAQTFLEKEEKNIIALVEKIKVDVDEGKPDSIIVPPIKQLIQVVKNWDIVAQPIQVSAKSRGLDHDASHRIANLVRGLAINLFNEHDKLDLSQQLTNMLQEVFAEVVEVAEQTSEDAGALEDIAEQRVRQKEEEKIVTLVEEIRSAASNKSSDSIINTKIDKLTTAITNWEIIAEEQGIEEDVYLSVAWIVRELAIQLFNEYDKLKFAQKLTHALKEVFADIDEIYERVTEDASSLDEIARSRRELINRFSIFDLDGEYFSYKGNRYNINNISHIGLYRAITNHKVNFVSTGETEEIRVYLTMNNGKEVRLTVDEQGFFLKRDKSEQITIFAEFYSYLSQTTFDRRVDFYESQIKNKGYFVYDSCYFYPEKKIVFKGKDFHLGTTSFLKGYGYVEMRKKDYGLLDKIKREVTRIPQFSTIVDTDVIFYLLKEHFSLSWK